MFYNTDIATMTNESREFLSSQLIKLGDMMGDGLHHEPDGYWIAKEYRRISKILYPEMYKDLRKAKNAAIDKTIAEKLKTDKCFKCHSELKQTRSGSKVVRCVSCGAKFKYKAKKKINEKTYQEARARIDFQLFHSV